MAYDFFPTKGNEIIKKCGKFPPVNVADMIKLHEALQSKYNIDAPINIDLGSKYANQKITQVNVTRALEGAITIKEIMRLGNVENLKLKFGNGSSGNRGAGNRGNAFEEQFASDIQNWWAGEEVSNKNHLKAILDLDKTYNLSESSTLTVKVVGGKNTPRPLKYSAGKIILENTEGIGTDVGAAVTDITLTKDDGEEIYLSLKFGPTTTFFNTGVRTVLTPEEIESGSISNKNGLKLLSMFGIEDTKFCQVFQGGKSTPPSYSAKETVSYDSMMLQKLLESGIGYGYHVIHKFTSGRVLSKKMDRTAMRKAAKTTRMRIFYGGKTGTGRRVNMECESSTYKFSLNIRDTQGNDGKPTRMMCDFKYK